MRSRWALAEAFQALHQAEPFLIPNAWDAGSARVLSELGFPAIATTSSGFAYTRGEADGRVDLEDVIVHVEHLVAACNLPLSVDLENGFGPEPRDVAETIESVAACGAVGGSIEDYDRRRGIYDIRTAVARIEAAVDMVRRLDVPFVLTARAENHIRGNPDLDDTIARLQAYERAGANVLYAPGLRTIDEITRVCQSVSRPVNVLATPELTAQQIFDAGAQRISVGGSLAWVTVRALSTAATALRDGDLSVLNADPPW